MKDTVTFETAARLKEAGFSQPTPEAGQWWYNPDIGIFLTGKLSPYDGRERHIYYPDTGKVFFKNQVLFRDCVFAPTATDIFRELPYHYHIGLDEGFMIKEFLWFGDAGYEFNAKSDSLENPAEAAAEAWLKLNDKK